MPRESQDGGATSLQEAMDTNDTQLTKHKGQKSKVLSLCSFLIESVYMHSWFTDLNYSDVDDTILGKGFELTFLSVFMCHISVNTYHE